MSFSSPIFIIKGVNVQNPEGSPLLHMNVSNSIREKIYRREWKPGQKLPSEHALRERYQVSRGTVRRALSSLVEEGLIYQKQGKGSYVSECALSHPAGVRPLSFAESLSRQGIDYLTEIAIREVIAATPEIANNLGVDVKTPVLHLVRVRSDESGPLICQDSYSNLKECPDLHEYDFEKVSLFDAVQQSSGRAIKKAEIRYSARMAGQVIAKYLEVEAVSPMLVLEQNIYLEDDSIIEWSFTWVKSGQEVVGIATQE